MEGEENRDYYEFGAVDVTDRVVDFIKDVVMHPETCGRAGREGPGKCFRLYQESLFDKLPDSTVPEIKRLDLSNVILQLKALGVDDIFGFDFMEKPYELEYPSIDGNDLLPGVGA
ncbi:hypothetical protein AgCh_008891 [Apium graveolens]